MWTRAARIRDRCRSGQPKPRSRRPRKRIELRILKRAASAALFVGRRMGRTRDTNNTILVWTLLLATVIRCARRYDCAGHGRTFMGMRWVLVVGTLLAASSAF